MPIFRKDNKDPKFDRADKIEQEAAAEQKTTMSGIDPQGEAAFDESAHADASATADANFGLTEEGAKLEQLELKVAELTEKLAEAERNRLLALADMDNLRKRMAKELENTRCNTTQDVVFPFLQVYDHFSMAVAATGTNATIESIVKGFEMIQKEFDKAFSDLNIEAIEAVGKPFDPNFHQAVAMEPSDTVPEGTVIRQWCRGYKEGSHLLKTAMVVVSSGPAEKADAPAVDDSVPAADDSAPAAEQD